MLPSIAEALPVSILEAMAFELPVVATNVGSVAELVRDGETGHLVAPGNAAALAAALLQLLRRRNEWSRLGKTARALVVSQYDIDLLNDRLVAHYKMLLDAEQRARAAA
jgi:glycosyltransferase involved in cell wall biosynthesis